MVLVDENAEVGGTLLSEPQATIEGAAAWDWLASEVTALKEAGRKPSDIHMQAIERIAPTLRTLRHADGSLARFHGGGRGMEGRLDSALAESGNNCSATRID